MTSFSDLKIETSTTHFQGDSISIERVFDVEISVIDFRIEDTKIERCKEKGLTKCLYLQINYKGELRVLFTGSNALMEIIKKVPKESFPFTTTIKKDYKRFIFT
jgi:hypothetical protein